MSDRPSTGQASIELPAKDCVSTDSSIRESLRLSTASMNIRVAQEDFNLRLDAQRSAAVREDDIIVLYPQSLHMDPEIYEEPQVCAPVLAEPGAVHTWGPRALVLGASCVSVGRLVEQVVQ